MERMPEVRLDPELARLVDARLIAEGQTWSGLVREALAAFFADPASKAPRRRRSKKGRIAKALTTALAAVSFEDRDAAAVALARSLADRLDEHPPDAKYLSQRLLATLVELRLTPAARQGVLEADRTPGAEPGATSLDRLRLLSQARQAGIPGLHQYLYWRDHLDDPLAGYTPSPSLAAQVEAVTRELDALAG